MNGDHLNYFYEWRWLSQRVFADCNVHSFDITVRLGLRGIGIDFEDWLSRSSPSKWVQHFI